MNQTFEFEDFEIIEELKPGFTTLKTVLCVVEMEMTDPGQDPTPASLNYPGDPGSDPTYEVSEVRLIDVPIMAVLAAEHVTLTLTETQFITFFTGSSDVINNALEWAAEQEVNHD